MTKEYKKITFSLRSLADLIRLSGKHSKEDFSTIEEDLNKIMNLKTPDDEFAQSINSLEETANKLLNHLEEIKTYASRLEYQISGKLTSILRALAQTKLLELLPRESEDEEAKAIKQKVEEIIRFVNKKLNEQVTIEKRLLKGKKIKGHFWDKLINDNKRLAKQEKKAGSLLEALGDEEEDDAYEKVKKALQHIINSGGKISHEDFQAAAEAIITYLEVLEEEFKEIFKVEVDVELQQEELANELKELASEKTETNIEQVKLNMRTTLLFKIINRLLYLIRRDKQQAKKERKEIKTLLAEEEKKI